MGKDEIKSNRILDPRKLNESAEYDGPIKIDQYYSFRLNHNKELDDESDFEFGKGSSQTTSLQNSMIFDEESKADYEDLLKGMNDEEIVTQGKGIISKAVKNIVEELDLVIDLDKEQNDLEIKYLDEKQLI